MNRLKLFKQFDIFIRYNKSIFLSQSHFFKTFKKYTFIMRDFFIRDKSIPNLIMVFCLRDIESIKTQSIGCAKIAIV
jgi:hypothetical protein